MVIAVVLIVVWIVMNKPSDDTTEPQAQQTEVTPKETGTKKTDALPGVVVKHINKPKVIDYNDLAEETIMKDLMEARKKDLGLDTSVDLVVKSNETFTVGGNTVSMEEVIEQAFAGQGKVLEKELDESGAQTPKAVTTYGVYVVQPGDNIWNIHFRMLREFLFASRYPLGGNRR